MVSQCNHNISIFFSFNILIFSSLFFLPDYIFPSPPSTSSTSFFLLCHLFLLFLILLPSLLLFVHYKGFSFINGPGKSENSNCGLNRHSQMATRLQRQQCVSLVLGLIILHIFHRFYGVLLYRNWLNSSGWHYYLTLGHHKEGSHTSMRVKYILGVEEIKKIKVK